LAEQAAPYRICDAAVCNVDGGVRINITIFEGETSRGAGSPEGVYDAAVCNVYDAVIIHIA